MTVSTDSAEQGDASLAGDFGWVVTRLVVANVLSLLAIPLLVKEMGVETYGYWAQFSAFLALGVPLATLNLQSALVRFLPAAAAERKDRDLSSVVSGGLALSAVAGIAILISRQWLADMFFDGRADVVGLLGVTLPAAALVQLLYNYLRAERRIRAHSIVTIAERLLTLGLAAGAVVYVGDVLWVVGSYPGGLLLVALALTGLMIRERRPVAPSLDQLRRYVGFAMPLMVTGLGATVVEVSDRYLLAYFSDLSTVGTYTAGYTVGRVFKTAALPFFFLLPPVLSRAWDRGSVGRVERVLVQSFRAFLGVAFLGLGLTVFTGDEALSLLANSSVADQAFPVLLTIGLSYVLHAVWFFHTQWLFLAERTGRLAAMWGTAAAANVMGNLVLIPVLGLMGAAVATLLSFGLMAGWGMAGGHRQIRVGVGLGDIGAMAMAAVAVAAATYVLEPLVPGGDLVYLAVCTVIGLSLFTGLLLLTRTVSPEEGRALWRTLRPGSATASENTTGGAGGSKNGTSRRGG